MRVDGRNAVFDCHKYLIDSESCFGISQVWASVDLKGLTTSLMQTSDVRRDFALAVLGVVQSDDDTGSINLQGGAVQDIVATEIFTDRRLQTGQTDRQLQTTSQGASSICLPVCLFVCLPHKPARLIDNCKLPAKVRCLSVCLSVCLSACHTNRPD